jgi:uncharacterized protein DUF11
MRTGTRIAAGLAVVLVGLFAAAPPAQATTGPDLVAAATFDQTTYHLGDTAVFTVSLTNEGDATVHNVQITGGDAVGHDITTFPALGFDLAPGQSKVVAYSGTVTQPGFNNGFIAQAESFGGDEDDANPDDNIASARARVLGGTAVVDGRAFDEAGGDPSTAPGVAGVKILLTLVLDHSVTSTVTSDTTGAFHVSVPTGDYAFTCTLPTGWAVGDNAPQGALFTTLDQEPLQIPLKLVGPTVTPTPSPTVTAHPTTAAPTTTTAPAGPQLPATGTPVGRIVLIGFAVLVLGGTLVALAARRRRPTT